VGTSGGLEVDLFLTRVSKLSPAWPDALRDDKEVVLAAIKENHATPGRSGQRRT